MVARPTQHPSLKLAPQILQSSQHRTCFAPRPCADARLRPQALTQDKMRSAASAEMAIATESLGESELTDDDFVSLGASPRGSYAEAISEPAFSMRHDLPQVPADVSSSLCRIAASGARCSWICPTSACCIGHADAGMWTCSRVPTDLHTARVHLVPMPLWGHSPQRTMPPKDYDITSYHTKSRV